MGFLFGYNIDEFVKALGLIGVFLVVFSESGLLLGFFLPGDSLLFTAGFLASQNYVGIVPLMLISFGAAVLGDNTGYFLGNKFGAKIFLHQNSLIFRKENLEKAKLFYQRHGGATLILARFIPFLRAVAPTLAGAGEMKYSRFIAYNVLGAMIWAFGLTLLGYLFGNAIPNVDKYFFPVIGSVIVLSFLPMVLPLFLKKKNRERVAAFIRTFLNGK